MNNLTKILLGGVALSALAVVPAMAQGKHPAFSFTAFHNGRVVNKTKLHNNGAVHVTYTFGVYTYIEPKVNERVNLLGTFFKWNSYSTVCSVVKDKLTFPKKTAYGKLRHVTETFSFGCPSGMTKFDGVELKYKGGSGTDLFTITHQGTFKNANGKYKGTANLDVNIIIE